MAEGVKRMAELVGVDHVGMGTDMLGFISPPVFTHYGQLPDFANQLLAVGFSNEETGKILGGITGECSKRALGRGKFENGHATVRLR